MNRAKWLILILLVLCAGARTQSNITSVMVGTTPVGAVFSVDGVNYLSNQTFLWPQGSKHIISFVYSLANSGASLGYQVSSNGQTQFLFGGWTAATAAAGRARHAAHLAPIIKPMPVADFAIDYHTGHQP